MARRLRYPGLTGTIGSGNLTNSATSHTFTAALTYDNGTTVPTLTGSDYFMMSILKTDGTLNEAVKVTAYNSGTAVATFVRAQEGTPGTAANSGQKITQGVYISDLPVFIGTGESVPSNTPAGPLVYRQAGWISTLLEDSPAVLLTLDEASGNFIDVSGNGRDFTPGTGLTRSKTALIADGGAAASADGSATAGHNIGSLASVGGMGASTGTLECVATIPAGSIRGTLIHAGSATANGFGLGIGNAAGGTGRLLYMIAPGVNYYSGSYSIPTAVASRTITCHLAMTVTGGVAAWFVNGIPVGSSSVAPITPASNLYVGGGPELCDAGIVIDHPAWFPTVLSDARIREHAAVLMGPSRFGPAGLPVPAGSGPLGWWDGSKIQPLGLT